MYSLFCVQCISEKAYIQSSYWVWHPYTRPRVHRVSHEPLRPRNDVTPFVSSSSSVPPFPPVPSPALPPPPFPPPARLSPAASSTSTLLCRFITETTPPSTTRAECSRSRARPDGDPRDDSTDDAWSSSSSPSPSRGNLDHKLT